MARTYGCQVSSSHYHYGDVAFGRRVVVLGLVLVRLSTTASVQVDTGGTTGMLIDGSWATTTRATTVRGRRALKPVVVLAHTLLRMLLSTVDGVAPMHGASGL